MTSAARNVKKRGMWRREECGPYKPHTPPNDIQQPMGKGAINTKGEKS
jgi:hypothetical protein